MKMQKLHLNKRWEIIVPEHRANEPSYNIQDGWEGYRLNSIFKHTNSHDVMFYIGAEEGEMPALSAMWGAKVVMVEPNPKVWSNIKAIWQANKLETPITFQGFASNSNTQHIHKVKLHEGFPPCADVINDEVHGFKELYLEANNYPQIRIDDISVEYMPPTQISIDVEGSEWEVLKGAEYTIDAYKPKIWLSLHPEFLFHQWGVYGRDVRNWLLDKGYQETLLDYQHEVHLYYE